MERLTTRHNGVAVIKDKSKHKEAMERLAFYENLEETLENTLQGYVTIKDFILMNAEWFKMMNTEPELADAMMITNEEVKKYKEWKKLEEQGLLLKLNKDGDVIE